MKKLTTICIITILTILTTSFTKNQSQSDVISKIQELLVHAEGMTYVDISGNEVKITGQKITQNSITRYTTETLKNKKTNWESKISNINWDADFEQYTTEVRGNQKLVECVFQFENYDMMVTINEVGKNDIAPFNTSGVSYFILDKDYEKFIALTKK